MCVCSRVAFILSMSFPQQLLTLFNGASVVVLFLLPVQVPSGVGNDGPGWPRYRGKSSGSTLNQHYLLITGRTLTSLLPQLHLHFSFRAFGPCFYPKRLPINTFIVRDSNVLLWYIKIRIQHVSRIQNWWVTLPSWLQPVHSTTAVPEQSLPVLSECCVS